MRLIPEYFKTATKAVLNEHGRMRAAKVLHSLINSDYLRFDGVDYVTSLNNKPSFKWCVDYVDYYIVNMD